jgi:putative PIN family toxin of toxin-antitoxin system
MRCAQYAMATKKLRIILDTNWYISATINKNSRRILYNILNNSRFTVLFCEGILAEYRAVIVRDKFKKVIKPKQALRFIDLVLPKLENIAIKTHVQNSRDPKDNYLLSLSLDGHADYLITGDIDLLVLEKIGCTSIVRLPSFLNESQIH